MSGFSESLPPRPNSACFLRQFPGGTAHKSTTCSIIILGAICEHLLVVLRGRVVQGERDPSVRPPDTAGPGVPAPQQDHAPGHQGGQHPGGPHRPRQGRRFWGIQENRGPCHHGCAIPRSPAQQVFNFTISMYPGVETDKRGIKEVKILGKTWM